MSGFKEKTVAAVFQNQVKRHSDSACVSYKKEGLYTDISWNDMNIMVHNLACYLLSTGIKKGDKIGLFSSNRYEWWVVDMAVLSIGAINVPIYSTNSAREAQYILKNSDSKICFAGTGDQMEKIIKVKRSLPGLKQIVVFDDVIKKNVKRFTEVCQQGNEYRKKENFNKRLKAIKSGDIATIIYTSGTTGDPKGVMLTHDNILSNVNNIFSEIKHLLGDDDTFLSFLPLSHALERTTGLHLPIKLGAKVVFAEGVHTLMENFKEIRPSVVISVPRIYEKIHAGIKGKVSGASKIKQMIFNWAMKISTMNISYSCTSRERKGMFAFKYRIAEKLVFSKLKIALGMERLKLAVSGGGPLSVSEADFFLGMGVIILEGYGLTETSPVTNFNRYGNIKPGTVGQPLPETRIRITEDGEILVRGPQVMKGYYKNARATKETFTRDGFLKTGDIGEIDSDGFLTITGRIKDIIVTSGGKNISPQNIENSLKESRFIEQAAVIGDRRRFLSALIIPSFDELCIWADKNKITYRDNKNLIKKKEIRKKIEAEIKRTTSIYSRAEQIRKFTLLDREWTQETGELTPTQKVKRKVVNKKFADIIKKMYRQK